MKKILIILILGLVFISGCINLESNNYKKWNETMEDSGYDKIIPEKVFVTETNWLSLKNNEWENNYEWDKDYGWCRHGKEKGENINYIYCKGLMFRKGIEQEIDNEGNILENKGTKSQMINLVLKPIEEEWIDITNVDVWDINSKRYEPIDVEYVKY